MRLPTPASALGLLLASERDDLETLPTEELRHIHACEQQRLRLTKTVGRGVGVVAALAGALAAGKLIRQ
jgi:hypothetical protein